MTVREIKPNIYSVGAIDWDRRLFDEIIPLPDGTSYNSYLIKGSKKVALIDTVDPSREKELIDNLRELNVESIDYIISNHAEQDHSGSIPSILRMYPMSKVVTNQKCRNMLKNLLSIPDQRFITVDDGEELSLGDKTLKFIFYPWVHWPETMLTYLEEDKILFTCDFLGSHLATSDSFATDKPKVYEAAKRYYAEIMMPFRNMIRAGLGKVKSLDVDIIAPSHGPMYIEPDFILDAYTDWISDNTKNEVVIAFVSMHDSTRRMIEHLSSNLIENDLSVRIFNLTKTDIGELAMSLVDATTLVVAAPTFLAGAHPLAVYASYLVNALRPKLKYIAFMTSYGWGGRAAEQIKDTLKSLKVEFLNPVVINGYPKEEDLKRIDLLTKEIVKRHRELFDM